jgi:hypothetical protein
MFGAMHATMRARGLDDIDFNGWVDYSVPAEIDRGFATGYTNHYRRGSQDHIDGSRAARPAHRRG